MKRREAKRRGHAMIELAASAAVMVGFLAATFQFGYSFYVYNQLLAAVGNGGRYAAHRTYRGATPEDVEKGRAAIRNLVVFGDARPAPDAVPVGAGLRPEFVKVDWAYGARGAPESVHVSISGYTVNAVFASVTLDGRPAVDFPYVGRYAPAESEP